MKNKNGCHSNNNNNNNNNFITLNQTIKTIVEKNLKFYVVLLLNSYSISIR